MAGPAQGNVTASAGSAGWTPTVATLAVLLAAQIGLYCIARYAFRTAHGG